MIMDLVDEVVECKYLNCPPFPVDFCRTSNHVPVRDDRGTPIHHASSYVQQINKIKNLERYYNAKVMAGSTKVNQSNLSIHFGTKSPVRTAVVDNNSITTATSPDAIMLT
jgi:hypothetical protein